MLNKTMLIGNLGADVETRYTKSEVAIANFRASPGLNLGMRLSMGSSGMPSPTDPIAV
ncbi:MAG: single-stranded DNA-binding protein [Desulfobulbaceae bacterium]|nr:MAG: single-stranded DNA-binding protein [Desulfobulbaceae bacterium]